MRYEPATHVAGGCQSGAHALLDYAASIGIPDVGCYNPRPVRGGTALSLHAEGRAVDLATVTGLDQFVDALVAHYAELGVQQVIWQRRFWRCDRGAGWHPYGGVDPHTGHAHVELTTTAAASLTLEAIRTIMEDDMPTAQEIAQAILDEPIETTYDVGTPAQRQVTVPLRTIIGNLAIQVDRLVKK